MFTERVQNVQHCNYTCVLIRLCSFCTTIFLRKSFLEEVRDFSFIIQVIFVFVDSVKIIMDNSFVYFLFYYQF